LVRQQLCVYFVLNVWDYAVIQMEGQVMDEKFIMFMLAQLFLLLIMK
jgi:hypothetical protein